MRSVYRYLYVARDTRERPYGVGIRLGVPACRRDAYGTRPSSTVASFAGSRLPPETTHTTGPAGSGTLEPRAPVAGLPASAAARGAAPAPSATTRARDTSRRVASATCSSVTPHETASNAE